MVLPKKLLLHAVLGVVSKWVRDGFAAGGRRLHISK